jgi:hypothetical protein
MPGVGAALAHRLGQQVDMRDAALVGHRDLAVEDERRQPGGDQLVERRANERGAVVAVATDQLDLAGADGTLSALRPAYMNLTTACRLCSADLL